MPAPFRSKQAKLEISVPRVCCCLAANLFTFEVVIAAGGLQNVFVTITKSSDMDSNSTGSNKESRERTIQRIKDRIRTYPHFPKHGIMFRDVFPLGHHPSLIPVIAELLCERIHTKYPGRKVDMVVGIDSRGFLFGPDLAKLLKADFIPARKAGKLPGEVVTQSYDLEYGSAMIEIQKEYLRPGKVAVIIDDLIATGGTMASVCMLLQQAKVEVLECQCIVCLPELGGKNKLPSGCPLFDLVQFEGE